MDMRVSKEFLEAAEHDGCVSVGGLLVDLGLYCECMTWARGGQKLMTRHHPACPKYDPEGDAAAIISDLIRSMRKWAAEEDGIPEIAWDAHERASLMINYDFPETPKAQESPPEPSV
jgi:hypothetical protein